MTAELSRPTELSGDTPPARRIRRWNLGSIVFVVLFVALIGVLFAVPYVYGPNVTEKFVELFILVILGTMWNTLAGFAGVVSIGQQAFIGLGAYSVFVLTDAGLPTYPAVVLAGFVCGAFAIPISVIVFRLRGGQLAIATWVIAEIIRILVTNDSSLGGGTGKSFNALNSSDPAVRQANVYWVSLAIMAVLIAATFLLVRSRLGLRLQAVRDEDVAAGSIGIRPLGARRLVFVFAAVGCGLGGSLTLINELGVAPGSIFSVQYSAYMIFMVLIGGMGTLEGPLIGALVFFGVQQEFSSYGVWYLVVLGAVAVLVTLVAPRGIWGTIAHRYDVNLLTVGYRVSTGRRRRGSS